MDKLIPAIEETAGKADRQVTRRLMEQLHHLPDTELLRTKLAEWTPDRMSSRARNDAAKVTLERQVRGAEERDRVIASRPFGCWCWGTGQPRDKDKFMAFDCLMGGEWVEWCICPEAEALRVECAAAQGRRRQARITEAWKQAEIPARFQDFTLASSPLVIANKSLAKSLVHDTSASWFLHGSYGVGKTGLAVGYSRWFLDKRDGHANVLFRSLAKLLAELRGTYGNKRGEETEQDVMTRYQSVSLLVLDDLGAEQVTESGQAWLQDRLYQIIGERHDEMKPMVFTSNLNLEQLNARLGERLTWRIIEMAGKDHIIEVKGRNLRV